MIDLTIIIALCKCRQDEVGPNYRIIVLYSEVTVEESSFKGFYHL